MIAIGLIERFANLATNQSAEQSASGDADELASAVTDLTAKQCATASAEQCTKALLWAGILTSH
jgi:hypothetical protein